MLEAQRNETRPRLADCDPDWQFCRHHAIQNSSSDSSHDTKKAIGDQSLMGFFFGIGLVDPTRAVFFLCLK